MTASAAVTLRTPEIRTTSEPMRRGSVNERGGHNGRPHTARNVRENERPCFLATMTIPRDGGATCRMTTRSVLLTSSLLLGAARYPAEHPETRHARGERMRAQGTSSSAYRSSRGRDTVGECDDRLRRRRPRPHRHRPRAGDRRWRRSCANLQKIQLKSNTYNYRHAGPLGRFRPPQRRANAMPTRAKSRGHHHRGGPFTGDHSSRAEATDDQAPDRVAAQASRRPGTGRRPRRVTHEAFEASLRERDTIARDDSDPAIARRAHGLGTVRRPTASSTSSRGRRPRRCPRGPSSIETEAILRAQQWLEGLESSTDVTAALEQSAAWRGQAVILDVLWISTAAPAHRAIRDRMLRSEGGWSTRTPRPRRRRSCANDCAA